LRARAVDGSEASYRFDAAGDVVPSGPVVSDAATTESTGNSGTDIAFMLIIAVGLAAVSLGVLYVRREVSSDRQPGMGFGEDPIWGGGSSGGTPAELTAVDEPAWKAEQPTPEETAET
jgi:hypothetical protein